LEKKDYEKEARLGGDPLPYKGGGYGFVKGGRK